LGDKSSFWQIGRKYEEYEEYGVPCAYERIH
jgi:hypothetical protein